MGNRNIEAVVHILTIEHAEDNGWREVFPRTLAPIERGLEVGRRLVKRKGQMLFSRGLRVMEESTSLPA